MKEIFNTSNTLIAYTIGSSIRVDLSIDKLNWIVNIKLMGIRNYYLCNYSAPSKIIARSVYTLLNDPIYADNKHTDKLMSEVIPFTL